MTQRCFTDSFIEKPKELSPLNGLLGAIPQSLCKYVDVTLCFLGRRELIWPIPIYPNA